eukprot:gene634-1662_t
MQEGPAALRIRAHAPALPAAHPDEEGEDTGWLRDGDAACPARPAAEPLRRRSTPGMPPRRPHTHTRTPARLCGECRRPADPSHPQAGRDARCSTDAKRIRRVGGCGAAGSSSRSTAAARTPALRLGGRLAWVPLRGRLAWVAGVDERREVSGAPRRPAPPRH